MRITNSMMINNSLRDINNNKIALDKYNTQLSTEKKIQKPSDDPIVAIRALRFRSNLSELDQYLERNIPDAEAWLELTEDALISAKSMIQGLEPYLVQGSTETLGTDERKAIIENLQAYRDQVFQDANADYANRTIFTGYKTDKNMTFDVAEPDSKYVITQKLTASSADTIYSVINKVEIGETDYIPADETPNMVEAHRVRLAYDGLDTQALNANTAVEVKKADGTVLFTTEQIYIEDGVYKNAAGQEVSPYEPPAGTAYLLVDSGEIVMSDDIYAKYEEATVNDAELSVTYQKTGFSKGDLRPEHYFTCTRTENGVTTELKFSGEPQDIEYTINFNQKLKVNTEGREVYSQDIVRDVDELLKCTQYVDELETRLTDLDKRIANTTDEAVLKNLNSVKEALEKERTMADEILQKRFEEAITEFQNHQQKFDLAITDVGNRCVRLSLNKQRLTSQQTNLEELKSKNEDADMAETAIMLTTASDVYEASLSATAKIMGNNLLDFI
ncbi:MAG: flagellar hook-associated protein FlgL [Lachnospiraceae bacterium]|nr:flagellar hook-associated protein FlgL [Lachnospiraceae bacterium]